jgi:Tfp pilus assembly protein PilE
MVSFAEVNNNKHKWMAIWSVIVVVVSVSAMITVPQLQRSLRHARETSALNSLMEIYRAEAKFQAAKNRYATLKELVTEGLIQKNYADGKTIYGYNFTDSDITAKTFTIHAVREQVGYGYRDFHITEIGDVYYLESREIAGKIPRGRGTLIGQ